MRHYVVGYAFSVDRQRVALIRKNRPEWAEGKLFPIGGHVEDGETPRQAMHREFEEEGGLLGLPWEPYTRVEGDGWEMDCFRCFDNRAVYATTKTDELVGVYDVAQIILQHTLSYDKPGTLFHDSGWLMLLALDTKTEVVNMIRLRNTE